MLSREGCMPQYRIAWLPGDGVGREVMDATRLVLDAVHLDAVYQPGDIGWEFWRREGDAFPARTIDLLKNVDAALFGAVTSKPTAAAEAELVPELKGRGSRRRRHRASEARRRGPLWSGHVDADRGRRGGARS